MTVRHGLLCLQWSRPVPARSTTCRTRGAHCAARGKHLLQTPCHRTYDPKVALAIIILLIGIPVGVFMLLRPKAAWWTFQSWKYKNPEANEPSDAAYTMSALGGVAVIVGVVVVAALAWTKPGPADHRAPAASAPAAPPSYTPARPTTPQNRGEIPIVAYHLMDGGPGQSEGKTYLNISYLVPQDADAVAGGMNTEPRDGCEIMQTVRGLGTDRVTVNLHLSWVDRYGHAKPGADDKCRLTTWSPYVSTMVVTDIPSGTTVLTDGPIVDATARTLTAAAPGNPVPNLYCTLDGCRQV